MDRALRARRSEARGERSPDELQGNRKRFLIGGAAVLLVLAAMGKLGLPGVPIHIDIDDDHRKGPVVTTADDLARAYSEDSAEAAKRFGGREIMVSGEFLRIVPDGYGSIDMRLKTSNADFPLGVDVAGASVDDAKLLRPGQEVTVSCRRVSGSGNDRWLQDCAIQPEGSATGVPAPPAPPSPPAPPPAPGGNSG